MEMKNTQPNLINLIDAEYNSTMGSNFPYFGAIGSNEKGFCISNFVL